MENMNTINNIPVAHRIVSTVPSAVSPDLFVTAASNFTWPWSTVTLLHTANMEK
jgi:hypothetical protein